MKTISICLGICLVLSLASISLALEFEKTTWPGNFNDAYNLVDKYGKDASTEEGIRKVLEAGEVTIIYVKEDCEVLFLIYGPFVFCYCNTHGVYAVMNLQTGEQQSVTDPKQIDLIDKAVGKIVKIANEALGLGGLDA